MAHRTDFIQQLRAVQNAARVLKNDAVLYDAADSLLELSKIGEELTYPNPDAEKIAQILERLMIRTRS
jgi:hypothetical protein